MSKKASELKAKYGNADKEEYQPYNGVGDDVLDAIADTGELIESLPIAKIFPDVTQPRYILPSRIRARWNGSPAAMPKLLEDWQREAFNSIEKKPPYLRDLLEGRAQSQREVKESQYGSADLPAVYTNFIALIDLAASIYEAGLQQPIKVTREGENYRIVMGERRWMAYQLLNMVFGEYEKIPAIISDLHGWERVVAQADENSQREDLTAIGKARQLARLLIEAHGSDKFDSYAKIVEVCDRPYFAQVANGNTWGIPRNMGPKFEKSMKCSGDMLRRYRALLAPFEDFEIDNAIWMKADDEAWTEGAIRAILPDASWGEDTRTAYLESIRKIINANVWHYDQIAHLRKNSASLVAQVKSKWHGGEAVRLTQSLIGQGGEPTLSKGICGTVVKNNHSSGAIWGVLFESQKYVIVERIVDGRKRSVLDFCEIIPEEKKSTPRPSGEGQGVRATAETTAPAQPADTPESAENTGEITKNYLTSDTPATKPFIPPAKTNGELITEHAVKYLGKEIRTKLNETAIVQGIVSSTHLKIIMTATGEKHQIHVNEVAEILPDKNAEAAPASPAADTLIKVGVMVMTRAGHIGTVQKISGRQAMVQTVNGANPHYIDTLRRLSSEEVSAHLGESPSMRSGEGLGVGMKPAIDGDARELLAIFMQLANFLGNAQSIRSLNELADLSMEEATSYFHANTLHEVFKTHFRELGATLEHARLKFGGELDAIEERLAVQND
jgi:hypothetical protein